MDDVNICWYPHAGGARSRTLNSKESPAQPTVAGARAQRFRDLRLSHSFVLLLQWVLIDAPMLKLMRLSVSARFLPPNSCAAANTPSFYRQRLQDRES
jgi:hypothetical protein